MHNYFYYFIVVIITLTNRLLINLIVLYYNSKIVPNVLIYLLYSLHMSLWLNDIVSVNIFLFKCDPREVNFKYQCFMYYLHVFFSRLSARRRMYCFYDDVYFFHFVRVNTFPCRGSAKM